MKFSVATLSLLATLAVASPIEERAAELVQSNKLRRVLLRSNLLEKSRTLEGFAYATEERNRLIGTPGHQATIDYLVKTVGDTGYYDVTTQAFQVPTGTATLSVDRVAYEVQYMTFTPAGEPVAPIVAVNNLGCDAADYPASVSGSIALISRGTCAFGMKSANAGRAGAVGVIIYNNAPGPFAGTLGGENSDYAPTVSISKENGETILAGLTSTTQGDLAILLTEITTHNVIAQSKTGDAENVIHVGAHSDSVAAGPGINDNGSGSIGILEVALQLTKFSINNAVRFSWWAAEEEGLLGAAAYVESLAQEELDKIRLYLNFDMIASPNYVYSIYDGDGSAFGITGPPGSAEAEKLFENFFTKEEGLPFTTSDFDGRSDYGPFLRAGVACGGLFTGAEGIKTEQEAAIFGGKAGVAYDVNYHGAGDNVKNLNVGAFIHNTKAIAHSVATYARSFDSLPPKGISKLAEREAEKATSSSMKFNGPKALW